MICKNCGTQLPDNSPYCYKCGTQFKQVPANPNRNIGQNPNRQPRRPMPNNPYPQYAPPQNGSSGLAIASMVLGIVALVMSCCFYFISLPCALIGLILGIVSLAGKKGGKGMAIAGVVCCILSLIPAVIGIVMGGAILSSAGVMGAF